MANLSHGLAGIAAALALAGAELDRPDLTAAARSGAEHLVSLGDCGRSRVRRPALPAARLQRPGRGHPHLVPRRHRHLAALRGPGPGRRPARSPTTRRSPGTAGACAASARRACPPACTPASGTTTGAAAVRRAWVMRSSTPGIALATTRTSSSHCSWLTPWSSAPCATGPTSTGASSSTTRSNRCCHPEWAGCRGRRIAAFLFHASRILGDGATADAVPRMDTWWTLPVTPIARSGPGRA